jgi:hypothetical protein
MEAMKKEIARLNSIIARGCMSEENKKGMFSKRKILEKSEKPGFVYVEGGKTNERKIIKEKECLEFKSTGFLFTQTPEVPSSKPGGSGVWKPRATQTTELGGSEKILGGSGICKDKPRRKARLSSNMLPRHITLVCRYRTIQLCPEGTCPPKRTRLMHLETFPLAMC